MVERADITNVLMQMRALRSQMDPAAIASDVPATRADITKAVDRDSFGKILKNAVDSVNASQAQAKTLATAYEKGDPTVDLPEVMVSLQKASVSFQAMLQVRNRLVSAYEDIMKMPM